MKKIVLNVLTGLLMMAAFTTCGGSGSSSGRGSFKIKMTTERDGDFRFILSGSGVATVDWGDGSEKVTLTIDRRVSFEHTYPSATIRTITVNGDNITELYCEYLTSLDVSKNTELTRLNVRGSLKILDVGKNKALTLLECYGHELTILDVSNNTELTELYCGLNKLTSLDVSKNTALTVLKCENNKLTSLDVNKNTVLTRLEVNDNQFTAAALNALFGSLHNNTIQGETKIIYINRNPGEETCDQSIAKSKGWSVFSFYMR